MVAFGYTLLVGQVSVVSLVHCSRSFTKKRGVQKPQCHLPAVILVMFCPGEFEPYARYNFKPLFAVPLRNSLCGPFVWFCRVLSTPLSRQPTRPHFPYHGKRNDNRTSQHKQRELFINIRVGTGEYKDKHRQND